MIYIYVYYFRLKFQGIYGKIVSIKFIEKLCSKLIKTFKILNKLIGKLLYMETLVNVDRFINFKSLFNII